MATLATPAVAAPYTMPQLKAMTRQFAPVSLTVDLSSLPPNEQQALAKLVEAARLMDTLFLRQDWAGNEPLLMALAADPSPLGRARLHAFLLYKGPWDRLAHNQPFLAGVPEKPAQANFYPADATKQELERWMKSLPPAQRKEAAGFYTEVRRAPDGKLTLVPYSVAFGNELRMAATLLDQAAALTQQPTLRTFLQARAKAFLSNDYYASDVAWMELDSSVDPTIGPYEVYNDEWFNAKAAFESFITLRDAKETDKLTHLSSQLQDIENHLPIPDLMKNPKLGALAPIRVVNEIYAAGDANKGVQTAAFNLPNDERITDEKGTKRVMLRNVQEAKFKTVLLPISKLALSPADQKNVSFDAFFTHILMHELMHGLGPHNITVNGKPTTARAQLEATYSSIEEAKADISGLFAMQYLVDKGVLAKSLQKTMYTTYLASMFRSIRFGTAEAHGKGVAMQLNYFLDHGAVKVGAGGRLTVAQDKIAAVVRGLAQELLTLEGHGDAAGAKKLLDTMGVVRPQVKTILDKLSRVPVDIEPRFTTAHKLLADQGRLP
jgi:hypothetical protein